MNIDYMTVSRIETRQGKVLSISISINGHVYAVDNAVLDYDKLPKEQLTASFRTLADIIEKEV